MSSSDDDSLSAAQIRGGRAVLNWSQQELADVTGLSITTVRKLELGKISSRSTTAHAIRKTLESAGLEFIDPDGVRRRPENITIFQGKNGGRAFFDDVYETARNKKCEVVFVQPGGKAYVSEILGEFRPEHFTRMIAIKDAVKCRCILTEGKEGLPASTYVEYRWISKQYVDSVPFYVYGDKYAIILTEPEIKITVIQSRAVADAFRRQFYSIWEKAIPLN